MPFHPLKLLAAAFLLFVLGFLKYPVLMIAAGVVCAVSVWQFGRSLLA